jgi:hypothetical protein
MWRVPGMTYAQDDDDLYITFYAESETSVDIGGTSVAVQQKTAYPNDGEISIVVNPKQASKFRMLLRIPTWTQDRFVPGELYRYVDSSSEEVVLKVNGRRNGADQPRAVKLTMSTIRHRAAIRLNTCCGRSGRRRMVVACQHFCISRRSKSAENIGVSDAFKSEFEL